MVRIFPCGRPTPRRSASWATSTAGTSRHIPCGPSAVPASGPASFPNSAGARPTNITSSRATTVLRVDKADPYGFRHETAPKTASLVWDLDYAWGDADWMKSRGGRQKLGSPMSIYEVHLGSWMRVPGGGQPLAHLSRTGAETRRLRRAPGLYARRVSAPDGASVLRLLGLSNHRLLRAHGTQRHAAGFDVPHRHPAPARHRRDPRLGAIPFPDRRARAGLLRRHAPVRACRPAAGISPGLEQLHLQLRPARGAQFPASATRSSGSTNITSTACAWTRWPRCFTSITRARPANGFPNKYGGRENLEAIAFLRQFNETVYREFPDVQTYAEESTAWPQVSRPAYVGGLGFGFKWDMGFMHDTLELLQPGPDPPQVSSQRADLPRHVRLCREFRAALSRTTRSSTARVPCSARCRATTGRGSPTCACCSRINGCSRAKNCSSWAPNSASGTSGITRPASTGICIQDGNRHNGLQKLVGTLNWLYRTEPALHEQDANPAGFQWVDCHDAEQSTLSWLRFGTRPEDVVLVVCNFTPVPRHNLRVGRPARRFLEGIVQQRRAGVRRQRPGQLRRGGSPRRCHGTAGRTRSPSPCPRWARWSSNPNRRAKPMCRLP